MVVLLALPMTAGASAPSTERGGGVVLGAEEFAPNGEGFGEVEPSTIFNGGVPSGMVKKISWKRWGDASARGRGLGSAYKPGGGYYSRPVKVKLKAMRIATCPGHPEPAYTKLRARVQKRPGGKFGRWFSWSGADTICSFP